MKRLPAARATVIPRWMILGEWRAHPWRIVTAVMAIAIGVALGFAVHLVNASALDRFARGLASVNGGADLRIQAAGTQGFDEALYPRLARLPGIAGASPVVVLRARLDGRLVDVLGLDVLRAGVVTPALLPRPAQGDESAAFAPDSVFLPQDWMPRHSVGDHVPLVANGREQRFRLAGTLPGVSGRALAVIDIAAAQDRFGRLGRLDRIDLKLAPGADTARVRAAMAPMLPGDAVLADAQDDQSRSDALSRAYRVNLDMLALVALLTGGFLVYSAQALSIARRRAHFALLRVMGASRRLLLGQLVAEGLLLGCVGAALGIALGLLIAMGVLHLVGGDLGSGYFSGEGAPALRFTPGAALGFSLLGLGAALVGSLVPAWHVSRIAPAVALRNPGDAVDPGHRPRIMPALLLALLGAGCALLPAVGGIALFGYGAIALLLTAGIMAMPWLARTLLAPLARRSFTSPAVQLAIARLWGAPSQAAVALSGIVASVGLMIAMAVMVASFRSSVETWLDAILTADIYATAQGDTPFDRAEQASLLHLPGVAAITFGAQHRLTLAPDRPPLMLVLRDGQDAQPATLAPALPAPQGRLAVRLSEPAARLYHLAPGATLALPLGARRVPVFVAGIYRDYGRQDGTIALEGGAYTSLTGDSARGEAAVHLAPGADPAAVMQALRSALPPALAQELEIVPTRALKARALAIFDRSFAITYGLEIIAVLVGLAGVAATTSAQTIARSREFGMLRHLGVTRRQIVAMLGMEGALLGLVGGVAGVALGCVLAQVLIHVVNPQSFNWTMETRFPLGLLAGVALALVAASSLTAMIAGRRATSLNAVRAVREDW
ncbi:FtsX-like permease family protein [Novosphingobium terrae]|uniref:FtsX-like permease family protein n=1 Tax=Novosphingobium terrae TaxID=2726189 RepID=UPI00198038B6|nr:FtsX-like permease family protein [Novosphingobium terrae]